MLKLSASYLMIGLLAITGLTIASPSTPKNITAAADSRLLSLDSDGDGIVDWLDSCPGIANIGSIDNDGDQLKNECDLDSDNDGVINLADACPTVAGSPSNRGC